MLHSTSFCRGVTWGGSGNQYILFNADQGSIDWYDFRADHGLGWDDHSDGVVRRYWNRKVKGVNGLMSHLSWNVDDGKVYVADTGNKRILVLDPSQGQMVAPFPGMEIIGERSYYEAPLKVLVDAGLEAPSGIEANGGLAFVTDAATSKIHAFSLVDGSLVRTLDTHLPQNALAGLNFGPDGKIYFVDRIASRVLRIDP
jgi:DNA-binding beta-propeller fold protein YncE